VTPRASADAPDILPPAALSREGESSGGRTRGHSFRMCNDQIRAGKGAPFVPQKFLYLLGAFVPVGRQTTCHLVSCQLPC